MYAIEDARIVCTATLSLRVIRILVHCTIYSVLASELYPRITYVRVKNQRRAFLTWYNDPDDENADSNKNNDDESGDEERLKVETIHRHTLIRGKLILFCSLSTRLHRRWC